MSILNECELEKFNAKLKENIDEHESEALDPRIQVTVIHLTLNFARKINLIFEFRTNWSV